MTEKNVPKWRLERIAKELDGKLSFHTLVDSRGNVTKRIVIDYKE